MPKKIAVIDGNSLMHRAFHAVPPTMNAPDGTPTNAVFGFMSMLLKFIELSEPDAIVCAFDAGKPAFRIEALAQYKAQRPPMDEDLRSQFPLVEQLLDSMAIPVVKVPGWEGDDILGTIAARDEKAGYETLLVTGDKDAYQLATALTRIVTTKKGITDVVVYGPDEVFERYGVTPDQFPDFLGLKGDSSDNIPGVPGIGDKNAAKLLSAYGSIDGIYENLDALKGKQLENLSNNRDAAFLSRTVATIERDLDFDLDVEAIAFPSFDAEEVTAAFEGIGFRSHLAKILAFAGVTADSAVEIEEASIVPAEDTRAFLDSVCASDEPVVVLHAFDGQDSLFGSSLKLAVQQKGNVAVFDGDKAKEVLVRLARETTIVTCGMKDLLQLIYPADSAEPALLTDEEVTSVEFTDLELIAYELDSSSAAYTPEKLAERYLGGAPAMPEEGEDALRMKAAIIAALLDPLVAARDSEGAQDLYDRFDCPLVSVLTIMERTGAALDTETLAELGKSTAERIEALRKDIWQMAGREFNVDSPKQVGEVLFDEMGYKPLKKTTRGYSTDARVLTELSKTAPIAALILDYRELAKIKSTYIDALPKVRRQDGRVHTSFNETVTTTGRLSSSEPNLQNIPVRTEFGRHIRECFVPLDAGSLFVSADYSQIELRLLAHLSQDEHLIEAFRSGEDFHASTASRVFGVPVDEVTSQMRSRAKAVNFGIVYGQQAYGLSQSLDIPFAEAKDMIDRYFEVYPGVRSYLDATVEQATKDGYASTMFGRKRHIPELGVKNQQRHGFGERTAMNHPMQGSAADIIKLAMIEVQRRLSAEGLSARLMLQVHDELDLSVPEAEVQAVSALLKQVMEGVVELRVPLVVDVAAAPTWAQAH